MSEKNESCKDNTFLKKQGYMADGIVTNTIMAAPDTLLGVLFTNWLKIQINFIIFYLWI